MKTLSWLDIFSVKTSVKTFVRYQFPSVTTEVNKTVNAGLNDSSRRTIWNINDEIWIMLKSHEYENIE
jgi:hypothetical protein